MWLIIVALLSNACSLPGYGGWPKNQHIHGETTDSACKDVFPDWYYPRNPEITGLPFEPIESMDAFKLTQQVIAFDCIETIPVREDDDNFQSDGSWLLECAPDRFTFVQKERGIILKRTEKGRCLKKDGQLAVHVEPMEGKCIDSAEAASFWRYVSAWTDDENGRSSSISALSIHEIGSEYSAKKNRAKMLNLSAKPGKVYRICAQAIAGFVLHLGFSR